MITKDYDMTWCGISAKNTGKSLLHFHVLLDLLRRANHSMCICTHNPLQYARDFQRATGAEIILEHISDEYFKPILK